MRISQSPNLFITVMLLICCTALILQCTEGADKRKLRDVLENRLHHCKLRQQLSPCKILVNKTVQANDQSLKKCCKNVGKVSFGQDCLCLMREVGRANNETLKLVEAVTTSKQLISSCAALDGVEDNCSGVAKALKRFTEIQKTTLQEDFAMSSHCDKAALNLRDVCGPTVAKARTGSGVDSKRKAESAVCCYELERFKGSKCACSLGSTVSTSKDVLDFLGEVRAVGGTLSAGCPYFNVNIEESCPKPTNQGGDKKPLLFDKCETAAQEAVKTCTPMINEAIAAFNKTKPLSYKDEETIDCCVRTLEHYPSSSTSFEENQLDPSYTMPEAFQPLGCVCNMTVYKEFEKASIAEEVRSKSARNNPQTVSCCNQLSKLIESPPQSCLCNLTYHKTVTSRATTTDFLTSDIIYRAVNKNCDPKYSLSNYDCTPYVDTPSNPDSFWAILARSFKKGTLFNDKGLCYPGVSGPRGC